MQDHIFSIIIGLLSAFVSIPLPA